MDDRGMDSDRSMGKHRSGLGMDRGRSIVGNSLIGDISNITTVGISNVVVDHLGPAVRKSHSVRSTGGVTIPLLILAKLGSTVVISYSILEGIHGRLVVGGQRGVARGHWWSNHPSSH